MRDRIVRVEIAHAYTHRTLFELDDLGVAAFREVPEWPPLNLRAGGLPVDTDWPVVILIHVDGEDTPYAGHPSGNQLWFAEDENPMDFYLFYDNEDWRSMRRMPVSEGVYAALEEKLGEPDPGGLLADAALQEYYDRCGRPPAPPQPPRAFPNIPQAIIE